MNINELFKKQPLSKEVYKDLGSIEKIEINNESIELPHELLATILYHKNYEIECLKNKYSGKLTWYKEYKYKKMLKEINERYDDLLIFYKNDFLA